MMNTKSPPLRILFLIDELYSWHAGSEQHLLWLLRHLPSESVEKHFIVYSGIRDCSEILLPIPPIVLGKEYGEGFRNFPRRFFELVRYIKANKIDIVHAFTLRDELIAAVACLLARCGKTIGHRRDIGYAFNWKTKWISRAVQFFKIPYIANSQAAQKSAFQIEHIKPERFTLIRNPVVKGRMEEGNKHPISLQEIGIPEGDNVVGMVATVRPIKGHEVLLNAAKIVFDKYPRTHFLVVGEQQPKEYAEQLQVLARDMKIDDKIIWFGGIDNPFRILSLFTVAVLSSHSESFSNAVLEYSVAGIPAVVTDVGGLREIVKDGETGFVVPPNTPEALAEKICDLLSAPQKREQFGKNGQRFVNSQYSEATILEQYLDFYRLVAENKCFGNK